MTADMQLPKTEEELIAYRNAYVVDSMKIAQVTLTVTEFRDVLAKDEGSGKRDTDHMMQVEPHPRVRKRDSNGLSICPGGATLRFTITPEHYYPIGITFVRKPDKSESLTDADRLGLLNFGQIKIRADDKHTLDVTDNYMDESDDDRYKFSIIIQNGRTGAIGIIDPDIDHVPN